MATGENVVMFMNVMPPETDPAVPDRILGTSSVTAEQIPVWDFVDDNDEYLHFKCALENYGGGGLTIHIVWGAATATSGVCGWNLGIRAVPDDAEDLDGTNHDYSTTEKEITPSTPAIAREVSYDTWTFSNGSEMDGWADGEVGFLRLRRNTAVASNLTGNAELLAIWGVET